MSALVQCPRCGHIWKTTTIRSNRKCKRCGRSVGRRHEIPNSDWALKYF